MDSFSANRSISFVLDGTVDTLITVTEVQLSDGSIALKVDIQVLEDGGSIGDMRALFFDLQNTTVTADSLIAEQYVGGLDSYGFDVTDYVSEEEAISTLGQDANIKGDVVNELGRFDVGVEIGTSGSSADDIQETTFLLKTSDGSDLTLDTVDFSDFGIRYTSVGQRGGDRRGSEKTGGLSNGVAASDSLVVDENASASVDLLGNDSLDENANDTIDPDERATVKSAFLDTSGTTTGTLVEDTTTGAFSGVVAVDGLELGTLTISEAGILSFDASGADVDSLAAGESRVIQGSYTTVVIDPSGFESLATAQFQITIEGTNDAPVVTEATDVSETLQETEASLSTTGSFEVADLDVTDVVTLGSPILQSRGGNDSGAGNDATLLAMFSATPGTVIDGTGTTGTVSWTFDAGTDAFDYLAVGESLMLTYRVPISDDNTPAGETYQDIMITIEGTNDAPVVTEATDVSETLQET
ncbi:VCBS domain-containing protein, partial [Ruegeria arenilitoris]|uniref:VCBS domain-containing protein n=1 Tax=Ruegeria arenilitoris TaxID=1173585 RepID=UPI001C2BA19B